MSFVMALPAQRVVINAWAAVVGLAPSNAHFVSHVNFVNTHGEAAYLNFVSSVARDIPVTTLANNLLTNLGLTQVFTQAEAVAFLNANQANLGGAIVAAANFTLNYVSNPAFANNTQMLAAQAAWVNAANGALNYAVNPANVNIAPLTGDIVAGGQVFDLKTGVDNIPGTANNDTINAVIDATVGAVASTFTALDTINGGAGTDTLRISAITDVLAPAGATVTNVENVTIAAAANVGAFNGNRTGALDLSTLFAGVNSLTITSGAQADFKAASNTAVELSGVTGGVEIVGGASQTVSLAAQGGAAHLSGTTGAVSFTSAKHANHNINIDGGSTVTVATTSTVDNGAMVIGQTTAATGAVSVTSNLNGNGTATLDQGAITVTGGSTVTVNSNLTITAKNETAGAAHTFGNVHVNGDGKTSSVTVNQNYAETEFTLAAVPVVRETSVVTFNAMNSGQTLTFNGLTFTASKNLTAAEVAAAFSNLTAADRQSAQGPVDNGFYTGQFSAAGWTSGAASGAVVTFTATDHDELDFTFTGTATAPTQVVTAGVAAAVAVTSNNTWTYGNVRVDETGGPAAAKIASVTVNGYSTADLGQTGADLNALTTLSLANSAAAGAAANVATSATTLGLTVNNVRGAVHLDHTAATVKNLNVTATGANSEFGLTAAAVQTLTVAGNKVLDIDTGFTLTALKTVTVTESAGLSIVATGANVTSVNSAATTGTVTAKIDAANATYTGGAGVDNVILHTTTVSKAISTAGGNDMVTLATGTTALAANISAGAGTDTLVMAAADAHTASAATAFETFIDGFEVLSLGQVAAGANKTVNLANVDDISHVISANSAVAAAAPAALTVATTQGTGTTTESAAVTFATLIAGQSVTVAGRTVTAFGAATAAEVGTAFSSGASAGNLTVSGTLAGWIAGAPGATVTFTSTTPNANVSDITHSTAGVAGALTLTNMANAGTLELTGAGAGATVTMTDATGTADSFNIVTKVDAIDLNFGTVSVAGVETLNLRATDISTDAIHTATLALSAGAAKAVNVTGQSNLTLDLAAATAVTAVDASALTGRLTLTATGTQAMTVTGGSGADVLTASGSKDVLLGGAGNDVLTGADLTALTGGAGNDTFMMNQPTNVNSYSDIRDLSAGDVIDLDATNVGTVVFTQSAIVLAGTAVFQDFANAAVNALGADGNDAAWFQFGGNTYIVQSGNTIGGNDFVNGSDSIIQITGLVNLANASYNQSIGTLEIA